MLLVLITFVVFTVVFWFVMRVWVVCVGCLWLFKGNLTWFKGYLACYLFGDRFLVKFVIAFWGVM